MNITPLRMLVEQPNFDLNLIVEEEGPNKPQKMYFEGIYMKANFKNKNNRVYSLEEMLREMSRYDKDMIQTKRALGELNHPTSVEINPERACHMVTEMRNDRNDFYGKSVILDTPMGQIVKTLMKEGVRLGVSSRALGKLKENNDHNDVEDFRLICCDVVHDPSVDTAFVQGIFEAKQYILNRDGSVCEFVERIYSDLDKKLSDLPRCSDARQEKISTSVIEFINAIKNI